MALLLSTVLAPWTAASTVRAAELTAFRVGEYGTFTRIVFQFDTPVEFTSQQDANREKLTVVFEGAQAVLPQPLLKRSSAGVRSVALQAEATRLKAQIDLTFPAGRLKPFVLADPARVVLDVYRPEAAPAKITLNAVTVKPALQPATAPPPPPPAPAAAAPPEAPAPQIAPPPQPAPAAPPRPAPKATPTVRYRPASPPAPQTQAPAGGWALKDFLLAALVLLSMAIVALAIFIRRQKHKVAPDAWQAAAPRVLGPADETIAAIDAEIRAKLANSD